MTEAESKKKTMETQSGLDGNALQSHDSTSVKKRRRRRKKKSAGASLSGNTDQSMNQIDSDDNEEQNTKEKVLDTSESLTQTMTENMETECDAKADEDTAEQTECDAKAVEDTAEQTECDAKADEDTAEQTECDAKADEDTAEQTECDAKADEDTAEQTECDAKADEDTAEQTECDAKAVEDTTEKTCTTAAVPQVIPQISGSSVPSGTVAMSNLHPTPNVVHSSSPPFTAIQSQQSRGTSLANSADPTAPPGSALEALLAGMKPISSTVEKTSVTKDNVSSQLTTDTNKPVFSHSVNTTIVRERDTSISSTSFSSTTSSYHQVSTQNAVQDTSLTRGNAYNVKSSTSSIPSSYTPSSSMNGSTSQSSSFSFQNASKQTGVPAFVDTVCVTSKNEATESTTTSTSTTPHGKVSSPRIVQHSNLQPEHFGIRKTASFNDTFGQRRYTDRELCEFFDLFDTNDTGRIKRAQFYSLMQALGISVEEVHVGYFDYMDRETFLTTFQALNTVEDEARCAFQLFSQRKKAFTSDDLLKVVRSVYPTISKEEVLDVFHYCDSDRDGLISLRDWFTLLTGTAAKTL